MENKVTATGEVSANKFTDAYLKFTQQLSRVQVCEEELRIQIPEKTIRCIWNDQLFTTRQLKTTNGDDLEVVFPGYWNFGAGPDFKSAAVKIDGVLYEGDAEIHVYSTDWKSHGHSGNPGYDNVVLHIFMWRGRGKDKPEKKRSGKKTPVTGGHIFELEIKDYLTKGILELNSELDFDNYPVLNPFNYGACHKPLVRLTKEKLTHLLNAAGDARVYTKMDRFHDRIIMRGYEQTFYEGVAEAMGYPINKQAFQTLAETVTLEMIRQLLPKNLRSSERAMHVESILFGSADLIDFRSLDTKALPAPDQKYFQKLKSLWRKYGPLLPQTRLKEADWKFSGIRPANYPYRRIAGLARLVARYQKEGMFAAFNREFKRAISKSGSKGYTVRTAGRLYDFFCVEAGGYWSAHYTPGGKKLAQPQQLVGPARSREITVNILIPIGLIHARAARSVELEAALNLLYQSGKGKSDNKMLRFMKHYILGNEKKLMGTLASDKQVQGLMQVYQDFCTQNENNCLRCQFPDVITRYFS
ncbi:hypothetical protein UZ36_05815 [Candidatus Nitromaritima sp. SCGC AAA799-C22]|nr:hypothetical protein UZ36_05815 [Candidatus Nitromaritima sp. SCGC AAA799-C22]